MKDNCDHDKRNRCQCENCRKKGDDYHYRTWYSKWDARKEKCKPKKCDKSKECKDYYYNGIWKKCC